MKRILSYITAYAFAAFALAGCSNEPAPGMEQGEGRLVFTMNFGDGAATRAAVEAPENVVVKIGVPNKGYTHIFEGIEECPQELWLANGGYFIEVAGGTPAEAGFSKNLLYAGRKEFTIAAGAKTQIDVDCRVTTTLITLDFDATVPQWTTDYSVTLYPEAGSTAKTVVFNAAQAGKTAYVNLVGNQTGIEWKFNATHQVDGTVVKQGTLANLLPGKHYKGSFKWTEKFGDLLFTLTVDDSTVDISSDIVIKPNLPVVEGDGFDLGLPRPSGEHTVKMTAASGIADIVLSGSVFGDRYDALADGVVAADLASRGIALTPVEENGTSGYEMTLSQSFYDAVAGKVTIEATDDRGNTQTAAFIKPTATLDAVAAGAVWATHAAVSGTAPAGSGEVKFAYRKTGGAWQYAETGNITGLEPDTQYQICMQVDGDLASLASTITTEAAPQIPNGNFEIWGNQTGSGNLGYYFYSDRDGKTDRFWDNGNPGSMTLGNSVTTSDTDKRPDSPGTRSVKMQSAFVGVVGIIGKFAAGNLYAGEYAGTSGMNGMVDMGQPFTSRPTAMKGWFKASPGSVDYAGGPLAKNDRDRYLIMVALVDWYETGFDPWLGREGRHRVNTGNQGTFLNYDTNPGVIAYGEISGTDAVSGWTEFTIPLEYRATDRTPKFIVIMACASRYGDYFAGSTSSTLFIDDFELVYDENVVTQQ